jgi:hypothetical protein
MKKVFSSNEEVCHVWAQQNQEHGRAGNIFFEGPTIYSYGKHFPMAKFYADKNVVLITTRGYSHSTSKHLSDVRRALRAGFNILNVRDVDNSQTSAWHEDNIEAMIMEVKEAKEKALKARVMFEDHIRVMRQRFNTLARYVTAFNTELKALGFVLKTANTFLNSDAVIFTPEQLAAFDKRRAANDAQEIARRERVEKIAALRREELKLKYEAWKRGKDIRECLFDFPIALRIKNEEVQTTRGANVPLAAAVDLARDVLVGADVCGRKIGHYTVNSLENGILVIGCHEIPLTEVERLFKK